MKRTVLLFVVSALLLCLFGGVMAQSEGTKVLNAVSPSVVRLYGSTSVVTGGTTVNSSWTGTGFFINDKQIVTNHHVVSSYYSQFEILLDYADDPETFYMEQYDAYWFTSVEGNSINVIYSESGNDMVNGLVVADYPELDLAIVEIDSNYNKRPPLKLSNEDHIEVGMDTYVVGFPGVFNQDLLSSDTAGITRGVLSKITYFQEGAVQLGTPYRQLIYDAAQSGGNSGGPIVDRKGNVIGISCSTANRGVAYYGIQVDELIAKLNQKGFKFTTAQFLDKKILYAGIGVLAAGVIAALVIYLRKRKAADVPTNNPEISKTIAADTIRAVSEGRASIQGISGQFKGIKKSLSADQDCVFGKLDSCTVKFDSSETVVSREHCRIHYSQTHQRFIIQDLGSSNGTVLVRGKQMRNVPTKTGFALANGDLIQIPDKSNVFRVNL